MNPASCRNLFVPALLSALLLASGPAHALRCGSKLIREGMLDIEVQQHCGEPTAIRDLGYVVRSYTLNDLQRMRSDIHAVRYYPSDFFLQHVLVTEYVYNLGPSKLMRVLTFEDGILTDVETLGYGYLEKPR